MDEMSTDRGRHSPRRVTADQVAALRAYLTGNFHLYEQLHRQLDPIAAATGFSALLTATFFEAVDRRFATSGTASEVTEFVGAVRARSDELSAELDSSAAERLIRAMLTDEDIDEIDPATRANTQFLLLYPLVEDAYLDEAGLDDLLAEARKLADEWTGQSDPGRQHGCH
jgi:hypothetical protein